MKVNLKIGLAAFLALAGTAWANEVRWIDDGGYPRSFQVALDELSVATAAGERETKTVAAAGTVAEIRRRAAELRQATGADAELVLYEVGAPRNPYTRRVLTKQVLVRAESGAELDAAAAGVSSPVAVDYAPGYFLVETAETGGALDAADRLRSQPGVQSAEPLLARQQRKKWVPNDTLFAQQWHLVNTGQGGGTAGIDVKVTNVWDAYRGSGILIGIVDDGLQVTHTDLVQNVNTTIDWDWNGNDADPSPNVANEDFHGTSCAGVAAARGNNGRGVSGAAPEATLVGYRLIGGTATDAMEASAMTTNNHLVPIKSNSWGPNDDGATLEAPGALTAAAFSNATATGRGGRGTILVWAGGNGLDANDNANYDGYANSIYTIAVAALTDGGVQSWYSEPGANLVVTAPSSGGATDIVTTDLMGEDGYNYTGASGELADKNYTKTFGGTSSATPLVAGILALVLEANPNLGWRDVQEILIRSATKNAPSDADWRTNSAGFSFNHKYGAGLVNARAAVALATNWVNLGAQIRATVSETNQTLAIPDNNTNGLARSFNFAATGMRVEHATVTLDVRHLNRGQLAVTLTSPSGMQSRLAEKHTDSGDHYSGWTFSSVRHWGEPAQGTWTLKIADLTSGTVGTMRWARVDLHGTALAPASNQPPVLAPIGSKSVETSNLLSFAVTAADVVDGDEVRLWATNLPAWATFAGATNAGSVSNVFSGTPTSPGTNVVHFFAADKDGTNTEAVVIVVTAPVPQLLAPVVQAATGVQATQFTANWLATANAVGYRLDVGTNDTFAGGGGGASATNAYHNGTLGAGTGGVWTETGLTQGSGYLIALIGDSLTTPALDFTGATAQTLTFRARTYGGANAANNVITVSISTDNGGSWTELGTRTPLSTTLSAMSPFDLSAYGSSQVRVKFETLGATATVGAGLDDVLVTSQAGGASAYVPGYENRDVGAATMQAVTGLTANATYYYRVRAYHATSNGPYSSVTSVVTVAAANQPPTFTAPANTNQAGTAGSPLSFQVAATTVPDADAVTLWATGVPAWATFVATTNNGSVSNVFSGTPPEPSTNVVVFHAGDKDGTNSRAVRIVVGPAGSDLLAPVVQAASGIQAQQFNANWLAAANATGYRLDVATNSLFRHTMGKRTATLAAGDLMIVTVNTDTNGTGKGFDAVPLVDLDAGTVIYFTDNGWSNGVWRTGEGIVTYTAPGAVAAGTVLSYRSTTANGFTANASFNLSTGGDTILAYQGSTNSPTFLYGIGWAIASPWIESGALTANSSMIPAGLSAGTYTIVSCGTSDNYQYNAANGTTGSPGTLLQWVASAGNWTADDAAAFAKFTPDFTVGVVEQVNDFVPGYENRDVGNFTTCVVTGLTEGATYHYRVRAYNVSSNGPFSGTTSVVTSASSTPAPEPIVIGHGPGGGATMSLQIASTLGVTYQLQYTTNLLAQPPAWWAAATTNGTGAAVTLEDADPADVQRYYRIVKP